MYYRAATDANGVVLAIGYDENQSGPYGDSGTWEAFTFTEAPPLAAGVQEYINSKIPVLYPAYRVVDGTIVSFTLAEMQAAYGE